MTAVYTASLFIVKCCSLKREEGKTLEMRLTSTSMSIDGLLPDPVAGARNGEDAAKDSLWGKVGVVDESMDDDVVGALEVLGLGQWGLTIV